MASAGSDGRLSEAPAWTREADRLFDAALPRARVIGRCTPVNGERARLELVESFRRHDPRLPRLRYDPQTGPDIRPALETAARLWEDRGPLGELYAARAREIALEVGLCREVGQRGFAALAERRYGRRDVHDDEADRRIEHWLDETDPGLARDVLSDDEGDPSSLVCRMRAEVGKRRLAIRVVVTDRLASLAAVGPGVIYVGRGMPMSRRDVARTVLHEIEGHAEPRLRAARAKVGIFARGTAHGSDEQEGRALMIEHRHGFLDVGRRLELARRHHAGQTVRAGADVIETVRSLTVRGTPLADAARIALRSHRGGGLARELVYVPAWLRVGSALERMPAIESVMTCGQVSVDTVTALRPWCPAT